MTRSTYRREYPTKVSTGLTDLNYHGNSLYNSTQQ